MQCVPALLERLEAVEELIMTVGLDKHFRAFCSLHIQSFALAAEGTSLLPGAKGINLILFHYEY